MAEVGAPPNPPPNPGRAPLMGFRWSLGPEILKPQRLSLMSWEKSHLGPSPAGELGPVKGRHWVYWGGNGVRGELWGQDPHLWGVLSPPPLCLVFTALYRAEDGITALYGVGDHGDGITAPYGAGDGIKALYGAGDGIMAPYGVGDHGYGITTLYGAGC